MIEILVMINGRLQLIEVDLGPPPTLQTLAVRTTLDNIESVTSEALKPVPWPVKQRLWDASKGNLDADQRLHLWKLLVQNGHRDTSLLYRRVSKENMINNLLLPLSHYIGMSTGPTSAWITALTISKLNVPRSDLYQLAQMPNLVALDICAAADHDIGPEDQPSVDNRVLKHFATHAQDAGAFQSLRVLILREFKGVTRDCMQHLNSFLRLSLFGVQNCGIGGTQSALKVDEVHARKYGWTTEEERGLLGQLRHEIDMKRTWDGMLRACVEMTAAFDQPDSSLSRRQGASIRRQSGSDWHSVPNANQHAFAFEAPLHRSSSQEKPSTLLAVPTPNHEIPSDRPPSPQPQADPPLLNFKLGPTCSGLIFSTPIIFFRCINGHIQEQSPQSAGQQDSKVERQSATEGRAQQRSASKNRRPSGPHDPPPTKRPKLKAGRRVQVSSVLEMEGVGRSLSRVELEGERGR